MFRRVHIWMSCITISTLFVACGEQPDTASSAPVAVWNTCDFESGSSAVHLDGAAGELEELRIVAVREASSGLTRGADGVLSVHVERAPHTILVLSSEEPARFRVTGNAVLVLVDGDVRDVTAPDGVEVARLDGTRLHGWDAGLANVAGSLIGRAEAQTGLALAGWHGCERGTEFAFYDAD